MTDGTHRITELLRAWNNGDSSALDRLWPLVDPELKNIARHYMSDERPGHILQPTALVNEALIKLIRENINWESRKQFYGFMAKRMRQVLVDYARSTQHAEHVDVNDVVIPDRKPKELLMLDEALTVLAQTDERKVVIVECRFFIGLNNDQTAEVLGISSTTVQREWKDARKWLKAFITR
jgi:RNA polymerase sigma-70 factor (ECF subfamily)